MCTIYFVDIDTFLGDVPPPPPYADEEIPEDVTGQVTRVQISGDMRHRSYTRFRLELGDQICALLVELGVHPVLMQDIKANPMLLDIWRDMSRDMVPLMCHIVRATRLITVRRVVDDTHSSSITHSSSTP